VSGGHNNIPKERKLAVRHGFLSARTIKLRAQGCALNIF